MDLTKLKGMEIKGSAYTCVFGEDDNLNLDIAIFYTDIANSVKKIECMPMIFHEIIHAIQIICEKRSMNIEQESEHFGYITSYITENLLEV